VANLTVAFKPQCLEPKLKYYRGYNSSIANPEISASLAIYKIQARGFAFLCSCYVKNARLFFENVINNLDPQF